MRTYLLQIAGIALAAACLQAPVAAAQTTTVTGTVSPLLASANDLGALPISQAMSGLVLQLKPSADLAPFANAVSDPASAQYRKWLTASQIADRFGASQAQVDELTAWLTCYGLQVTFVAQSRGFLVVSGTVAQIENAFGVQLDRFLLANGAAGFANLADPVLPAKIASSIANIRGLNSFAYAPATAAKALVAAGAADAVTALHAAPLAAQGWNGTGVSVVLAGSSEGVAANAVAPRAVVSDDSSLLADSLLAAAEQIDANTAPVLRVAGGCVASLTTADMAWFEQVALQANAQGITLVAATADCSSGAAFPASLGEVTAVGKLGSAFSAATSFARSTWQNIAGLPVDGLRHTPDLSVTSPAGAGDAAAFAGAVALIVQKANGLRQGNINSFLYSLANLPGVFSTASSSSGLHALASSTNTPTSASFDALEGLGVPDLTALLSFVPLAGSTTSSTQLVASNYNITYGQSVTLTATVLPSSPTPTGSVLFSYPNGYQIVSLSGNTASLVLSSLDGGNNTITASYYGDTTYAASGNTSINVTVQLQSVTITTTPTGTPTIGVSFPVTVTVSGSSSGTWPPMGTVTVTPQGASNSTAGTGTLGRFSNSVTVDVTVGQAGPFNLVTAYAGNIDYSGANQSTQITVAPGTTTTALTYSPTPPVAGQPITLSATVTGSVSTPVPTGTVQFYDGTTQLTTGSLASGVATATATLSPGKTHSLTAKYVGDTNFSSSTSSAVSAVGGTIASVTGLSSSTYTSTYGSNVTFTAVVTPDPSVTTTLVPSGKVNFYSNGTLLGFATLTKGVANYSTTALPVGLASITATYVGDTNFATSNSSDYNGVTVSAAAGTLTASVAPSSSVPYGATATVTATLTLSNGGTPTGTITATIPGTNGGTYTGTLVPNTGGSATATIVVNAPPPGNYTITVACATATTNYTCAPTTVALGTVKGITATTVSFVPAAPMAGQTTQLTAIIATTGGGTLSYTYTGSVTFYDNGAAIATAAVASNQATTNVTFKANVVHNITAIYSGDINWTGSSSTVATVTAAASPTTTTLATNLQTALVGTNVILTATVGSSSSILVLVPTGSVTFYDNYNGVVSTLGTSVLSASGPYASIAILTSTGLQGGTHSIFSIYSGDSNFATSTSGTLIITEQDFNLVFVPGSLTLTRGQSGQVAVILGTVGGFTGNITFGCTPPPDTETTCSFLPSTIASGGSTTLYIGTTAPSAVKGTPTAHNSLRMLAPVVIAGLLLLAPVGRRKFRAGLLVLMLAAALANFGCADVTLGNSSGGSGSSGGGTTTGTPQGTMNFTITTAGTSSSSSGTYTVRHTTSYMVTAQ
jgi:hypothetical protein